MHLPSPALETEETMDTHRFDALTKALASATTRRRLLRGMLGGSLGAMVATRLAGAPRGAAAQSTTAGVAEAINAYRQSQGLPPIPVSDELTRVAKAHVTDLATYHPEDACNRSLHSWSNHGNWTSGCYDPGNQATWPLMWNKPREIANYQSNGYEIAAWATPSITADQAVALWRSDAPHDDVMLNHGIWANLTWQALGGWAGENYACAWFGEAPGTAPPAGAQQPGQTQAQACPWGPQQCLPGYVWRVTKPDDLVCVTPGVRAQAAEDNAHAAERVDPACATTTCPYGPNQCLPGYVWRDAWDGDAVCVTPDVRTQAHDDNAHAAERIDPACAAASQPQTLVNSNGTPALGGPPVSEATPVSVATEPMATAEVGTAPEPTTSVEGTTSPTEQATAPGTEPATAQVSEPATEAVTTVATEAATEQATEPATATEAP
jgi:hypothetical protein